jgi:IclR family pca regulon transcriptional regulator
MKRTDIAMVILNESLRRGLDLLRAFSRLRNPGLRHLSEATGMAKATTLRYLRTLEEEGYVTLDPETKVYRLTPLVFELGHAALISMAFPKLAEPYMDQLATDLGVTVNLARLDNIEIVMVGRAFALQDKFVPTPIRIDVGERLPALLTALGRILLAEGVGSLDECLAVPLTPPTRHSQITRRHLTSAVQQAGRQGYAIVDSELVEGWTSCAISLSRKGDVPYAIGVTASSKAWPAERLREIIVPRLDSIRDLLVPDHNRAPARNSQRLNRKD